MSEEHAVIVDVFPLKNPMTQKMGGAVFLYLTFPADCPPPDCLMAAYPERHIPFSVGIEDEKKALEFASKLGNLCIEYGLHVESNTLKIGVAEDKKKAIIEPFVN